MRAFVLSISNVDAIPPGSVLYTCRWILSDEVAAGDALPLPCEEALASDPDGVALGLRCASGEISVAEAVP